MYELLDDNQGQLQPNQLTPSVEVAEAGFDGTSDDRHKYGLPTRITSAVAVLGLASAITTGCSSASADHSRTPSSMPASIRQSTPAPGEITPGTTSVTISPSPTKNHSSSTETVPAPASRGKFTMTIYSKRIGAISMQVYPMSVPEGQGIRPPEPPGHNWMDTTRYVNESAYPSAPSTGNTVVAGHACVNHACPLTPVNYLGGGKYTVSIGDKINITDPEGKLIYGICGIGLSPKYVVKDGQYVYDSSGEPELNPNLQVPGCGGKPVDLEVVNCEENGGISTMNIVIAATLEKGIPRP